MTYYIFPIKGWKNIGKAEPFLFSMPTPLIFLAWIDWSLLAIPVFLYWAIGVIWNDFLEGKG